jgi:hypothetical protein
MKKGTTPVVHPLHAWKFTYERRWIKSSTSKSHLVS